MCNHLRKGVSMIWIVTYTNREGRGQKVRFHDKKEAEDFAEKYEGYVDSRWPTIGTHNS